MEKEINENIIEIEGKKYKFIEADKSVCCKNCDLRKDRRCHLLHRICISDNRKDKKEGYFKRIEETTMVNKNIMKKEELEEKLKISKKTCIHCPTEESAEQVLSIFHQLGLKWFTGTHYTSNFNWDKHKGNTVYYPFEGEFSSLNYARLIDYKIISAIEFISLHTEGSKFITLNTEGKELIALHTEGAEFITLPTEGEEFDLESYSPKGELQGFPKEIIARMLDYQEEQGNPRDISVFEKRHDAGRGSKGFNWNATKEGRIFWYDVINNKNFNLFFEKYPKKDNSQYFKVGDKVFYYITNQIGIIKEIKKHKFDSSIDIVVDFGDNDICEYEISSDIERPFLLHYREDYDYNVIDFNNLPKRQAPKRWRAEEDGVYNFVSFDNECWFFSDYTKDDYDSIDNINYNSGNYFSTEVEAEIIAQKLNTYFKQLIQEEHEHEGN